MSASCSTRLLNVRVGAGAPSAEGFGRRRHRDHSRCIAYPNTAAGRSEQTPATTAPGLPPHKTARRKFHGDHHTRLVGANVCSLGDTP